MAVSSYANIVTFLVTTLFYYLALKPSIPYEQFKSPDQRGEYMTNHYMYLAIYVSLVIFVQFLVNSAIVSSTCGGNVTDNMGVAGVVTVLPWTLMFGVLVVVLSMYPGFKSAFADVVGYYYVSGTANRLLVELLRHKEAEGESPSVTPEEKRSLEVAADAILKICGNTSILINQMVPENFAQFWEMLKPLMKEKYKVDGSSESVAMQNELFEVVTTRDNIGEAMWYIYTGVLLTSVVQLKLTTRGCASNPKTMEANYRKFVEEEEKTKQKQNAAATTYTI